MTPDAPRPDLDEAEPWAIAPVLRDVLDKLSLSDDDRTRPRLVLTALRALGYEVVRGAALADAQAEIARLRAARERALVLADDLDKEAGEDGPADNARVTDEASRGYLAGVANAYGEAARRLRLSMAITAATVNSELGVAALAAAPAPAEDEDDELGALELVGALFEAADNMLGHLAPAETVAPDDSYVDDLRRARDALAEWHAAPAPAEDEEA